MSVVGSWLRGLLRASGVTLLIPIGLLGAVVVAATLGGSGLGSVGQLVGGPEVPGGAQQAARTERSDDLPAVPPRSRRSPAERRAARAASAPARRTTSGTGTRPARRRASTPTVAKKGPTSSRPAATPPVTTTTTTTTTTPPPPTTTTETNPIRRLGGAVQGLVEPLPIVGPVASGAVGTVIDLLAPGK